MNDDEMTVIEPKTARTWTEAPASATVKAKYRMREWMITLRGETGAEVIHKIDQVSDWLDKHAEDVNVEAPTGPDLHSAPTTPVMPTPEPAAAPNGNGNSRHSVKCVMLEVGTSYSGGKTQLKFSCDGLEHPLTYTKTLGDMVKLLQPIGAWTAEHIVIGKKYAIDCMIDYVENTSDKDGKTYKNVVAVRPA